MTWMEILQHELFIQFIVGFAGAATMAITDFRDWFRFMRHLAIGSITSMCATPIFSPAIIKLLSLYMPPSQDDRAAVYITGAFSIYLLEFVRDFRLHRKRLKSIQSGEAETEKEKGSNNG